MGTVGFGESFAPIAQYEKQDIHPVFPHFSYCRLGQNLSPDFLAPLYGAAFIISAIPWNPSLPTAVQSPITMKRAVFRDKPAQERTEKRFSYSDGTDRPVEEMAGGDSAVPLQRRVRQQTLSAGDHVPTVSAAKCRSPVWRESSPLPENRLRQGLDVWERMPLSRLKSTWDQSHSVPVTVSRSTSRVS